MATKPTKTKIKNYLKAHGHDKDKVDALTLATNEQTRLDLCGLHGVTREEYGRAGV